ncbi:MAG: hypothetical protein N2689_00095 [Verrucomicrobiae bacterium]|nr:hypothetical protein [Verrucomicrobiae bacterium]
MKEVVLPVSDSGGVYANNPVNGVEQRGEDDSSGIEAPIEVDRVLRMHFSPSTGHRTRGTRSI